MLSVFLLVEFLLLSVVFYSRKFQKAAAFLTLAILWLFTCWKGYRTAAKGHFHAHRIWMMRSFWNNSSSSQCTCTSPRPSHYLLHF